MNKLMIIAAACLISSGAAAADALSITVLKIDRSARQYPTLSLSVQNPSNQRLDTTWSCVFFDGKTPAFEGETIVSNVPPHGNAVSQKALATMTAPTLTRSSVD
jgi:hypothetical protein